MANEFELGGGSAPQSGFECVRLKQLVVVMLVAIRITIPPQNETRGIQTETADTRVCKHIESVVVCMVDESLGEAVVVEELADEEVVGHACMFYEEAKSEASNPAAAAAFWKKLPGASVTMGAHSSGLTGVGGLS